MSNKDFPGISNDQLFKNLYSSDIKSTNLQASSLTCDSLSFSGTYPIATVTGSVDRAFTTDEISSMSKKGHLFIHSSGTTGALSLTLGPDTADRAKELLGLFGIGDTTTKRLIRITPCVNNSTHVLSIKNDTGGQVSVKVAVSGAVAASCPLIPNAGKTEGYILVSQSATNVILFDIICPIQS
jgi:hypothetical protein